MAALLTSVRDDKDKSALYLNECRRMGIKVLPPDVNESDADFTPRGTDIRFGLAAIRNVGANVVGSVIEARKSKGRFETFGDYLAKADAQGCNKKTVESLIKAGAFDSLGQTRRGLMAVHMEAIDAVMENKRAAAIGQYDLFGEAPLPSAVPNDLGSTGVVDEWEKTLLLAYEREMLGLYVSDHPLLGIEHVLATLVDRSISAIASDDLAHDQIVTIGGLVTSIQRKMSRQGAPWAIVTVEDLEGAVDVMFYSQTYANFATQLTEDAVVVVRGRVDKREDVARLVALDMTIPDVASAPRGPLVISMAVARCTPPTVERLKDVLRLCKNNHGQDK